MKNFMLILVLMMGLTATSALTVLADSSTPTGGGNQLGNQLQGGSQTHWYEKAAAVQAAEGVTAGSGTLLTLQNGSYLYMEGDSTLHKYQIHANSLKGSAVVKATGDLLKALQAGKVGTMTFDVPVKDFKSRESGLDNNADKALKADQNPDITFALDKESLAPGAKDGATVMTATGSLSIAGATAPVTLTADTTVKNGQVELKGVQKLKMSDYKVTPPSISLLVTSITCTDEITVYYDVIFAPVGEANSEAKN